MPLKDKCPKCGCCSLDLLNSGNMTMQSCSKCGASWVAEGKGSAEEIRTSLDIMNNLGPSMKTVTCPQCHYSFETPTGAISGFQMKECCAKCGHVW